MASIFTYEPDPPRVSSPWLTATGSGESTPSRRGGADSSNHRIPDERLTSVDPSLHLEAEPQEGPTEYKLHLLLRPRRSLSSASTTHHISGSQHSSRGSPAPSNASSPSPSNASNLTTMSIFARQHRLEQLTTQLLWRLQQSSPHHSTSFNNLVLPSLPTATPELRPPEQPAKLLPGLEESNGALYEIGVSDDGRLVGITMDEMTESLTNLRAMAASLGCVIDVKRMVIVSEASKDRDEEDHTTSEKLYVAEAYVKPVLNTRDDELRSVISQSRLQDLNLDQDAAVAAVGTVEQVRVSLTGATTCGKSSLLGTLSTSTLDNGRGKSRLSLLKHRHEIASGVTSSVAQDLVGYQSSVGSVTRVLNYAHENIETWNDIQATPNLERLAILIDSAGHPRFRRTTVRGLVGWAPHWTFLCIAANEDHSQLEVPDEEVGNGSKAADFAGANAHISVAHLDLCLKLGLPFVVVITKFDEATRSSFRQLLSSLLTRLKQAGRKPLLMSNDAKPVHEDDLQAISLQDQAEVHKISEELTNGGFPSTVPILFTSAVKGTGIGKLHALLCSLPVYAQGKSMTGEDSVFYIDDSYTLPVTGPGQDTLPSGSVISGYLTNGSINQGNTMFLGPLTSSGPQPTQSTESPHVPISTGDSFLEPRSFNDALARATSSPRLRPSDPNHEWRCVKVISVRNLRLPVHTLRPDQVGTIGIVPVEKHGEHPSQMQTRKGMVLVTTPPVATHAFTARFAAEEASSTVVGSVVVAYCKSVRAGARIVAIALDGDTHGSKLVRGTNPTNDESTEFGSYDEGMGFAFDDLEDEADAADNGAEEPQHIRITFQFVACKENIPLGAQVLVMPSGGPIGGKDAGIKGLVGSLEGVVGTVVQSFG